MRDVPADDLLTTPVVNAAEGRRIQYLTSRYERVPANRQAAIRIHGTVCQVCGFDFYRHYGVNWERIILRFIILSRFLHWMRKS